MAGRIFYYSYLNLQMIIDVEKRDRHSGLDCDILDHRNDQR